MNKLPELSQAWTLESAVWAFAADKDIKEQIDLQKGEKSPRHRDGLTSEPIYRGLIAAILSGEVLCFARNGSQREQRTIIPPDYFKSSGVVAYSMKDHIFWKDIQIFDVLITPSNQIPTKRNPRNAGRRAQIRWDKIVTRLNQKIKEDRQPKTKSELKQWVEAIAEDVGGPQPGETTIRDYFMTHHKDFWDSIGKKPKQRLDPP